MKGLDQNLHHPDDRSFRLLCDYGLCVTGWEKDGSLLFLLCSTFEPVSALSQFPHFQSLRLFYFLPQRISSFLEWLQPYLSICLGHSEYLCLPGMWLIQIWSPTSHSVPWTPPGIITECRAWSKTWAPPYVDPKNNFVLFMGTTGCVQDLFLIILGRI